jgi:hypothetical protein
VLLRKSAHWQTGCATPPLLRQAEVGSFFAFNQSEDFMTNIALILALLSFGVTQIAAADQFIYAVVPREKLKSEYSSVSSAALDKYGKEGWEFVGCQVSATNLVPGTSVVSANDCVFKKRIQDPPASANAR